MIRGRVRLKPDVAIANPETANELREGMLDREENGAARVVWNGGEIIGWIRAADIEPVTS